MKQVVPNKEIFICHSSFDKELALKIVEQFENKGRTCWISYNDIKKGRSYPAEINKAIKNCSVLLVIFTKNSNCSEDVITEVTLAADKKKTIIPLIVDDIEPNDDLEYHFLRRQKAYYRDEKDIELLADEISKFIISVPSEDIVDAASEYENDASKPKDYALGDGLILEKLEKIETPPSDTDLEEQNTETPNRSPQPTINTEILPQDLAANLDMPDWTRSVNDSESSEVSRIAKLEFSLTIFSAVVIICFYVTLLSMFGIDNWILATSCLGITILWASKAKFEIPESPEKESYISDGELTIQSSAKDLVIQRSTSNLLVLFSMSFISLIVAIVIIIFEYGGENKWDFFWLHLVGFWNYIRSNGLLIIMFFVFGAVVIESSSKWRGVTFNKIISALFLLFLAFGAALNEDSHFSTKAQIVARIRNPEFVTEEGATSGDAVQNKTDAEIIADIVSRLPSNTSK